MEALAFDHITRGALRLFRVRRNVEISDNLLRRASRELGQWVANRDAALREELSEIDDDFASRGVYLSGPRLVKRAKAKAQSVRDFQSESLRLEGLADDLRASETVLERSYRTLRKKSTPSPLVRSEAAEMVARWHDPERDPHSDFVVDIHEHLGLSET